MFLFIWLINISFALKNSSYSYLNYCDLLLWLLCDVILYCKSNLWFLHTYEHLLGKGYWFSYVYCHAIISYIHKHVISNAIKEICYIIQLFTFYNDLCLFYFLISDYENYTIPFIWLIRCTNKFCIKYKTAIWN